MRDDSQAMCMTSLCLRPPFTPVCSSRSMGSREAHDAADRPLCSQARLRVPVLPPLSLMAAYPHGQVQQIPGVRLPMRP
jgi:hypothetical protein